MNINFIFVLLKLLIKIEVFLQLHFLRLELNLLIEELTKD